MFENDDENGKLAELAQLRAGYTDKVNAAIGRGDDSLAAELSAEFHHEITERVFGISLKRRAA
jgi:hypothetical protein